MVFVLLFLELDIFCPSLLALYLNFLRGLNVPRKRGIIQKESHRGLRENIMTKWLTK